MRRVATDPVARGRFRMVEVAQREGVTAAARQYGVSRPTVYKVLQRFEREGAAGLLNRPRGGQGAIAEEIVEAIVLYKVDNPERSTRKIQELVRAEQGVAVSRQTVWRVLSDRGLARCLDRTPIRRFARPQPNDLWQIDLMEKEKVAFGTVHLVGVLDDCSRYLVAGRFSGSRSEEVVLGVLKEALEKWGLPEAILADRGKQFRAHSDGNGAQSNYEMILDLLGVRAIFARAYHPQTKGKLEKFFQFVQRDFLSEVRERVSSLAELNARFDEWAQGYNERHSHSSLGGKPPATIYRASMRETPLDLSALCEVPHRRKVSREAKVRYRGERYSVPASFIGDHVWVMAGEEELTIQFQGRVIARHARPDGPKGITGSAAASPARSARQPSGAPPRATTGQTYGGLVRRAPHPAPERTLRGGTP